MNSDPLAPVPNKEYKLFLVEVDDDNRERVLAARVRGVEVKMEPQYHDVFSDYYKAPIQTFVTHETASITLDLVPRDGVFFTIENFTEEDKK